MAHTNIDERRAYVKQLLDQGIALNHARKREIAALFTCTHSAIYADVIALTQQSRESIYVGAVMRRRIHDRDEGICQYCGIGSNAYGGEFIVEHIIPAAIGGDAKPYNLVVACHSCNTTKRRNIWIPRNIDSITITHPDWHKRVISMAIRDCRITQARSQ